MQGIKEYNEISEQKGMEDLVQMHTGLVTKIAKSIRRKLPSHIELEDLLQAGFIGLIEASKNYQNEMGASFETFASFRIKGSILDELRKNSWCNRESIKKLKEIGEAVTRVEQAKLRQATSEEVAEEMKISLDEYNKICQIINASNITCIGERNVMSFIASDDSTPEESTIQEDFKNQIKNVIATFPEREQILLSLYYIENLTFKEISEVLDLTEARVSQLHASLLSKLARKLNAI